MVLLNRELNIPEIMKVRESLDSFSLLPFEAGNENVHLTSAIVRHFKNGHGNPEIQDALNAAFGCLISELTADKGITHICRVLSSHETKPQDDAPLAKLERSITGLMNLECIHPFRRTTPRPAMSSQRFLSGTDVLEKRIRMAGQDVVFEGKWSGANVLILDDIRCLGASESVWAWVLERFGGVSRVVSVSLAQMQQLDMEQKIIWDDTDEIRKAALKNINKKLRNSLDPVWVEAESLTVHEKFDCMHTGDLVYPVWRFLADGKAHCPTCGDRNLLKRFFFIRKK